MSYSPNDARCKEFIYEVSSNKVGMQWDPTGNPNGESGDGSDLPTSPPFDYVDITFDKTGEPIDYGSTNKENFDSMIDRTIDWMLERDNDAQLKIKAWLTMADNYKILNTIPRSFFDPSMIDYVLSIHKPSP